MPFISVGKENSKDIEISVGKVAEEWHIENLQGLSARHADDSAETINADLLAFIKN